MDFTAALETTGTAAYAVSSQGEIVAWNREAERLLGFRAARVIGQSCCATLAGVDLFGNRFCGDSCPVRRMVTHREPVHDFELVLRDVRGRRVRVRIFILVSRCSAASEACIIHLIEPIPHDSPVPNGEGADPRALTSERSGTVPSHPRLTAREVEILRLLREGNSTQEVADQLFICPKTVRNHLQNIYEKLAVHNRLEAVCVARRAALI